MRRELEELKERIEQLEYWVDLVYQSKYHPSAAVFYELRFTPDQEKKLYDILDKFLEKLENEKDFEHFELEHALSEIGITYQALKSIFNALWEEGRFIPVIVAYVKSLNKPHGSLPTEYDRIWKEIEERNL